MPWIVSKDVNALLSSLRKQMREKGAASILRKEVANAAKDLPSSCEYVKDSILPHLKAPQKCTVVAVTVLMPRVLRPVAGAFATARLAASLSSISLSITELMSDPYCSLKIFSGISRTCIPLAGVTYLWIHEARHCVGRVLFWTDMVQFECVLCRPELAMG